MIISHQEKELIDNLVLKAEKRVRQARWTPMVGLISAIIFLTIAVFGIDLIESMNKNIIDTAWGPTTVTANQPVTHKDLKQYAELQSLQTVNQILTMGLEIISILVLMVSIWQLFRFRPKAQDELVQLRVIQSLISKQTDITESGSRGFFSPSPHTTWHAGPHQAVPRDYRAVAG